MEKRLKFGDPGPDSFRKIVAVVDVPYGADYLQPTPFVGPLAYGEELVLDVRARSVFFLQKRTGRGSSGRAFLFGTSIASRTYRPGGLPMTCRNIREK